jgi:hypothetical protein
MEAPRISNLDSGWNGQRDVQAAMRLAKQFTGP